jgi:hypothetical protein
VNGKMVLILLLGLFALWSGCKALGGQESDVEIDWAGRTTTITCSGDGEPVNGPGFLTPEAEEACKSQRSDQRGRAPIWMIGGLVIIGYAAFQIRGALAKKK